jgi:excisionase family DNA binding protein
MNLQTLTIHEAARMLGKTGRTVSRWISLGLIPVIAVKQRTRRLCRSTVEALQARLQEVRAALSYEEAGRRLKLKARTIRAWAAQGILPKVKGPDGRTGVAREAVEGLLREGEILAQEELTVLAVHSRG